jgi:hypothetical protein
MRRFQPTTLAFSGTVLGGLVLGLLAALVVYRLTRGQPMIDTVGIFWTFLFVGPLFLIAFPALVLSAVLFARYGSRGRPLFLVSACANVFLVSAVVAFFVSGYALHAVMIGRLIPMAGSIVSDLEREHRATGSFPPRLTDSPAVRYLIDRGLEYESDGHTFELRLPGAGWAEEYRYDPNSRCWLQSSEGRVVSRTHCSDRSRPAA